MTYIRIWNPLRKIGRVETDDILTPWPSTSLGADAHFIWGKESIPAYAVTHGLPEAEQKMPIGCICAVCQRLDGLVSADADWGGGELVTPPIVFAGRRLVLNLDTSAMGACQVGLLDVAGEDVPGFAVEACDRSAASSISSVEGCARIRANLRLCSRVQCCGDGQ